MSDPRDVTIAILARNQAHVLPTYLACLEGQSFPRARVHLYVRTNDNRDETARLLERWLERVGPEFCEVHYDAADVPEPIGDHANHVWDATTLPVIVRLRQESLRWAAARGTHYFTADCDNFLGDPDTLEELAALRLRGAVVAPLLHALQPGSRYSNFHGAIDANGYLDTADPWYDAIREQRVRGLLLVPVVHCTYFVDGEAVTRLADLGYDDGSARFDYVMFSSSCRAFGIDQYLDNRRVRGYITFATSAAELAAEPVEKVAELTRARSMSLSSHGARIRVTADDPTVLQRVLERLPPGATLADGNEFDESIAFAPVGGDLDAALDELESRVHHAIATYARDEVFVHAGVVEWRGRAIVIPGRTMSGKSTLVTALVRAGATYYSDEYAVIGSRGEVHPYAKPISCRVASGTERTPRAGIEPIPLGTVVATRYEPDGAWRPEPITVAQAAMVLLDNAVAARTRPRAVLAAVSAAVRGATAISTVRADADVAAAAILATSSSGGGAA